MPGDAVVSTATTFNDTTDEFTVINSGYYQVSSFVGFNANRPDFTLATQFVAVNFKIQRNLGSGWTDITGIREVFVGLQAGTGTGIETPTAFVQLNTGDRLRVVIERPGITIGGTENGTFGAFPAGNGQINLPNGQSFTKLFTLIKLK